MRLKINIHRGGDFFTPPSPLKKKVLDYTINLVKKVSEFASQLAGTWNHKTFFQELADCFIASYRQHPDNKYPPLHLNDEEQKMAMKEGMKFPSHYPLTRLVGKLFT